MRLAAFAPLGLQLLCLFSTILNVPFKNLSNKCRKEFAPALRGIPNPQAHARHKLATQKKVPCAYAQGTFVMSNQRDYLLIKS